MPTNEHVHNANHEAQARLWQAHAARLRGKINDCLANGDDPDACHVQIMKVWADNADNTAMHYQRRVDAING